MSSSPLWWNYISAVSVSSYVTDSIFLNRLKLEMPQVVPLISRTNWLLCVPVDTSVSFTFHQSLTIEQKQQVLDHILIPMTAATGAPSYISLYSLREITFEWSSAHQGNQHQLQTTRTATTASVKSIMPGDCVALQNQARSSSSVALLGTLCRLVYFLYMFDGTTASNI